jgi:hypothetical protein
MCLINLVDSLELGSWNNDALIFIRRLGSRLRVVSGEQSETAYLLQRLSIAIQRRNVVCFANSF